jgi:hypothetical protein
MTPGDPPVRAGLAAWRGAPLRPMVAAALLGAACVAWAAYPAGATGRAGVTILVLAACCVAAGAARLAATGPAVPPAGHSFESAPLRLWQAALHTLRWAPWAEGVLVGALLLEAQHRSRPWHTGLLGAALLGYLIATHLAESAASRGALRGQLPVLAAGFGLLVLAAGTAFLPSAGTGLSADWLRVVAAVAAVAIGGLVLPR